MKFLKFFFIFLQKSLTRGQGPLRDNAKLKNQNNNWKNKKNNIFNIKFDLIILENFEMFLIILEIFFLLSWGLIIFYCILAWKLFTKYPFFTIDFPKEKFHDFFVSSITWLYFSRYFFQFYFIENFFFLTPHITVFNSCNQAENAVLWTWQDASA